MRDLSLHILDLIENSIRAEASAVQVSIRADKGRDRLTLAVTDDGRGLMVNPERALDPFFTTKKGKRTGLGLSLLSGAAQRAGGEVRLLRGQAGGLAVEADFGLSNIDRPPMGDLAETIASAVCADPKLDLQVMVQVGRRKLQVRVRDIEQRMRNGDSRCVDALQLAKQVLETMRAGLQRLVPDYARL